MMILQGADKSPQEAKSLGFINEVVAPGKTVEAAKAWVKSTLVGLRERPEPEVDRAVGRQRLQA